jgi:uncharacterized MAPEG superfamily protein
LARRDPASKQQAFVEACLRPKQLPWALPIRDNRDFLNGILDWQVFAVRSRHCAERWRGIPICLVSDRKPDCAYAKIAGIGLSSAKGGICGRKAMSTELWYLFLTSVLLAVLWIPFIVGQVLSKGLLTAEDYRRLRDPDDFPDWVRRANRAHINLVEQFGAFAGLVIVAHLAGISNGATALAAAVFFWARIAHAIIFLSGAGLLMARTLIFTVAWLSLMVLAWQILVNTPAS